MSTEPTIKQAGLHRPIHHVPVTMNSAFVDLSPAVELTEGQRVINKLKFKRALDKHQRMNNDTE